MATLLERMAALKARATRPVDPTTVCDRIVSSLARQIADLEQMSTAELTEKGAGLQIVESIHPDVCPPTFPLNTLRDAIEKRLGFTSPAEKMRLKIELAPWCEGCAGANGPACKTCSRIVQHAATNWVVTLQ